MRPAEQAQYQKTKWEVYSITLPLTLAATLALVIAAVIHLIKRG
jgi:hypothetical protein